MEWHDFVKQSVLFVAKSNALKDSWCLQRLTGPRQESSALANIKTVDVIGTKSNYRNDSNSNGFNQTHIKDLQDTLLKEVRRYINSY